MFTEYIFVQVDTVSKVDIVSLLFWAVHTPEVLFYLWNRLEKKVGWVDYVNRLFFALLYAIDNSSPVSVLTWALRMKQYERGILCSL